ASDDRAWSVSSMRNRNAPPSARAAAQLYSAVRAPPRCSGPVGNGANRRRGGGWIIGADRIADPGRPAKRALLLVRAPPAEPLAHPAAFAAHDRQAAEPHAELVALAVGDAEQRAQGLADGAAMGDDDHVLARPGGELAHRRRHARGELAPRLA